MLCTTQERYHRRYYTPQHLKQKDGIVLKEWWLRVAITLLLNTMEQTINLLKNISKNRYISYYELIIVNIYQQFSAAK